MSSDGTSRCGVMAAACALAALSGCGPSTEGGPDAGAGAFIAFKRDFADFLGWEPFHVEGAADHGGVHFAGARTVYVNARPPPGSTEWPQGTVLVKAMDDRSVDLATGEPQPLFAIAKRGGGFNAAGAKGWEWVGLVLRTDGQPLIEWRGPWAAVQRDVRRHAADVQRLPHRGRGRGDVPEVGRRGALSQGGRRLGPIDAAHGAIPSSPHGRTAHQPAGRRLGRPLLPVG